MWVRFLGQEDSLEVEMATHSSILAWEIPWTARRSNQSVLKEINPDIHNDEAEAPGLWPFDAKSPLTVKAPDAGKD